jgi:hypothetical protein
MIMAMTGSGKLANLLGNSDFRRIFANQNLQWQVSSPKNKPPPLAETAVGS